MGKPTAVKPRYPPSEFIGRWEPTRGSETSQYPEEEKSTEIPQVAASERGTAQTRAAPSVWALPFGGCGADFGGAISPPGSYKTSG
jgi:hypothetical protein